MPSFDYLKLITILFHALASALYAAITYPFTIHRAQTTYKQHVSFSALRTMLSTTTSLNFNLASISPTTQQQYEALAKKQKFQPLGLTEGTHVHGFWIGNPSTARKILIWYHGGGYTYPCSDYHYNFLWDLYIHVSLKRSQQQNDTTFAIFIQKYDLTSSGATYPTQLRQAASTLNYVLKQSDLYPSRIILAGDSAGGHLALSVLSHLLHPHPDPSIPRIVPAQTSSSSTRFAGILLVSPWTSFDTSLPSFTAYESTTDYLPATSLAKWSADFLGSSTPDPYNEPERADASWWEGLDAVVDKVGITAGGGEVLLDGLRSTVEKMKTSWMGAQSTFEFVEAPGECHDMALAGGFLGEWYMERSGSVRFIREWVEERATA